MREARLAEMDLVVDHAGQQMQAARRRSLRRPQLRRRIDIGDRAAFDHDRDTLDPLRQHDLCVLDQLSHAHQCSRQASRCRSRAPRSTCPVLPFPQHGDCADAHRVNMRHATGDRTLLRHTTPMLAALADLGFNMPDAQDAFGGSITFPDTAGTLIGRVGCLVKCALAQVVRCANGRRVEVVRHGGEEVHAERNRALVRSSAWKIAT